METKIIETKAREENIVKYFNTLKKLYEILQLTKDISMLKFSEQNNITKNLSTVLQKGGVIKCTGIGRAAKWEWTSIEPTRQMAIKVLKELSKLNPPRKNRGGKRDGSGRKSKIIENRYLDSYTIKIFFGIIKINIKLNYKST